MVFAHDTGLGLAAAAALVNTDRPGGDALTTVAGLDAFVQTWGWTGWRAGDVGELADVRALRPRLRALWQLEKDDLVERVNAMLRDVRALPQLVAHDGFDHHLHATPSDAPLADRMLVEAAMAFVDVVRQQERHRLRTCEAEDCTDVLVDLSRNCSRRYCSTACGNRMNVAAFRARQGAPDGGVVSRTGGGADRAADAEDAVVCDTDAVGSDADDLALSQARAASVVAALQPQLPGVTLTPDGRGETELVAERRPRTVRTTRSRGR